MLVKIVSLQPACTAVKVEHAGEQFIFEIPFSDAASIENAIHCCALMCFLKYPSEIIIARMKYLTPVAMRLEMKEGINNCSIINDSYNSDLVSLGIALDFLAQQQQHPQKTLILSDILQSGKPPEVLYKEVSRMVYEKGVNRFVGIGQELKKQQQLFKMPNNIETLFFESTENFLRYLTDTFFQNETILLKGARSFEFERISKALEKKIHTTVLEINLNAVIHNLQCFRSCLRPDTKVMAVVKAFSYGSGSFEIANVLQFHKTDYLAVAYADEGIALRQSGITLPIMVMNPEEGALSSMIAHQLEPEIYNFRLLNAFSNALKKNSKATSSPYPIHIKLDTGMHRLGFDEKDLPILQAKLLEMSHVHVASIFSHLAASDNPEHDIFTYKQLENFNRMYDVLVAYLGYRPLRHILNSAGIVRFPQAQMDMVRIGIGLYGIDPSGLFKGQLEYVSTLKTTIAQIKSVSKGESVGYDRKAIVQRDSRIAIVNIGYADGLNRALGNGRGMMMVNGIPVPIIGNICMDMCMLDVTDIQARENDEVIVFGKELPIEELAKKINSIPYEILTGISNRVKRIYYYE